MRFYLTLVLITLLGGLNAQDKYETLDSLYQEAQSLKTVEERLEAYFEPAYSSANTEEIKYWYDKIKAENTSADSIYWNGLLYFLVANIHYYSGEFEKDIQARRKAIEKFQLTDKPKKVIRQMMNIGNAYSDLMQSDSAIYYYNLSIERSKELEDYELLASSLLNLSTVYNYHGEKQKELETLLQAIDIAREHEVTSILQIALFNLAVHYAYAEEYERSEELAEELSALYKTAKDYQNLPLIYNLWAKLKFDQGDPEIALLYLDTAMQIYQELEIRLKMAHISLNIGQVTAEMGNPEKAEGYLLRAKEVYEEYGDHFYATSLHDLALVYYRTGRIDSSIKYLQRAIQITDSIGRIDDQSYFTEQLAEIFHEIGKDDSAYMRMLEFKALSDSLERMNSIDAVKRMEAEFQNERKQLEIDNLQKESRLKEVELQKQANEKRLLFGGLGAAILLILLVSYAFVQKRKNNRLISIQKDQLEEKNREITDSINYASKIQEAVLPSSSLIKKHLPKSFTLYLPKDIVAGDFYWFDKLDNTLLIAVADCTGHGVPGAMVSVVCSNALNRAVREYKLSKPSDILNKCQELVAENLGNTDADVKDGMDIALCAIDSSKNKIQYAGAYNPLWVIGSKPKSKSELIAYQNEGSDTTLYELKADKQAIGNSDIFQEFHNHELTVDTDSLIYLFSDGYLDQFGGENGKKLKSRNLKNRLLALNSTKIEDQGDQLEKEFNEWKGNLEQIDDVCIIGFQI